MRLDLKDWNRSLETLGYWILSGSCMVRSHKEQCSATSVSICSDLNQISVLSVKGATFSSTIDKVLNDYFSSVGSVSHDVISEEHRESVAEELANHWKDLNPIDPVDHFHSDTIDSSDIQEENSELNLWEISSAISRLNNKATGPDGIHNKMLKEGGTIVVKSLKLIFDLSWRLGKLPRGWKEAKIVAIPKRDSGSDHPGLFRPISLISCVGKV